ncbi:MAG: rhomboid family intramembrane serine protease [Salaquimonas sp.]|jgi:membrane associated rhomboid family serine protease|nr:rhomboid family intramembrane serine protease [Salaquimonas sp.]
MFIPLHDANHLRHIRRQYVTYAIIVINCLIWLFMTAIGAGAGNEVGAQTAYYSYGFIPAVANGYQSLPPDLSVLPEYATYISYAFLHGNFMHLVGNMLFVWVFGDNVEDAMGHIRFIGFFLACAVAGAWLHALVQPHSPAPLIGASGAAAGILTAYLMLHPRVAIWVLALGRIPLRIPAMWIIGAWIAFQLFSLLVTGDEKTSWGAHVGGIIAGAILLPLFKRRDVPLFDKNRIDMVVPGSLPPEMQEEEGRDTTIDAPTPSEPASDNKPPESDRSIPWGRQPR